MDNVEDWLNQSFSREHTNSYDDVKLGPIQCVLAALPQPPRPVTIAGTKGKGSTQRFLECALLSAGAKTVIFTSPHVFTLNERWRVNGENISDDAMRAAAEQVAVAEKNKRTTHVFRTLFCHGLRNSC